MLLELICRRPRLTCQRDAALAPRGETTFGITPCTARRKLHGRSAQLDCANCVSAKLFHHSIHFFHSLARSDLVISICNCISTKLVCPLPCTALSCVANHPPPPPPPSASPLPRTMASTLIDMLYSLLSLCPCLPSSPTLRLNSR